MKRLLAYLLSLLACAVALGLPFGLRRAFGRLVGLIAGERGLSDTGLFRAQFKFWNRAVLGFVFYLGLPFSKLLFALGGRSKLAPKSGAPTYWVERESPERFVEGIDDPF
ncbi:MAG: hypothetical protein C4523_06695 [Myxococcales bacterium]|nr:MAG: hypothetical protein C4523_06695 [Myxococcales bacterium]